MTKKQKKITKMWACGMMTHAEASRRLKASLTTTYSILARALKEIHYTDKDYE